MNNTMKKRTLIYYLFVLSVFAVACPMYGAAEGGPQNMNLMIGTQIKVSVPGLAITRVEVSDETLVKASLSGSNKITLTGLKKGTAVVTLWQGPSESVDYVVITWNTLPDNIKAMVKDIPGLSFIQNGTKLAMIGALLTEQDADRVNKIAEVFSADVDNLTYYNSKQSKQEALKHILKVIGNSGVKANFSGDNLVLTGTVHRAEDKERAEVAARAYVGEKGSVSNTIMVIDLPVEIDMFFVQLKKTIGSDIGANENLGQVNLTVPSLVFNPKFDVGDALNAGALSVGNLGLDYLMSDLSYLQSKGLAKIIDKPHVSTISGKPGHVQYGGEIGVKTVGSTGGGSVDYKEYGLIFNVTPVVDSNYGEISLEVSLEVSQPIAATSGADVEFQKFSTATHGNVKVGETLVLSGLKQLIKERVKRNVPVLGQIPILDLIFAGEDQSDVKTDIVVFLTPHLPTVKNESIAGEAGSRDVKDLYNRTNDPDMTLNSPKPEDR